MPLRHLLTLRPLTSTASSALTYVPAVLLARALAFVRTLLVAWLLNYTWRNTSDIGDRLAQSHFGAYQTALEFVNLGVPLLLMGAGDVFERYVARIRRERSPQQFNHWLTHQALNLLLRALVGVLLLACALPWVAHWLFDAPLYVASLITILLLVLYQYLASILRGMRTYGAAAGFELLNALLLLIFSLLAALLGNAWHLMYAYAASVLLPILLYVPLLIRHLRQSAPPLPVSTSAPSEQTDPASPAAILSYQSAPPPDRTTSYAAWTLLRLLCIMAFGFLTIWGVGIVAKIRVPIVTTFPFEETANFALPYRIAQLLGFLGVTLWSSVFAIAATSWSHGQRRRARVQLFRVGRLGTALLIFLATLLLLARPFLARVLPHAYHDAILTLLPGMLALFIWYALLSFLSTYADLQESPHKGATLWATAVIVLLLALATAQAKWLPIDDPKRYLLTASTLALALPLFILAPLLLARPLRMTATAVPLLVLSLAPISLLSPDWVVAYIATPILLAALFFLYTANLLLRATDRKSFRRWRTRLTTPKSSVPSESFKTSE